MRPFLIFLILLIAQFCQGQNNSPDSLLYKIVIDKNITSSKTVLIIDETITYKHQFDTAAIIDSNSNNPEEILARKFDWEIITGIAFDSVAYRPLMRYYLSIHKRKTIKYKFPLQKVVYLPASEIDNDSFWEHVDQHHSDAEGLFSFSSIFYSNDGTRAVFYYGIRRKKGKGIVVIFKKSDEHWEIISELKVWYN